MHKKIQGHGVMHHVASERASVARLEGVLVNPLPIWAAPKWR